MSSFSCKIFVEFKNFILANCSINVQFFPPYAFLKLYFFGEGIVKGKYFGFFGGLRGRVNKFFLLWANHRKSKFLSVLLTYSTKSEQSERGSHRGFFFLRCRKRFHSNKHQRGHIMKKTILIALFLFLNLFLGTSSAVDVTLFGPKQYLRTTGSANIYTDTFSAIAGEARLIVNNGDWDGNQRITDAISSASVVVNGQEIFGPSDFNKQVYSLEAVINLLEENSISVELTSNPGSYLTI